MAKLKFTCHICDHKSKSEEEIRECLRCGADMVNTGAEYVEKKSYGPMISKALPKESGQGYFFLTNKRLIFIKDSNTGTGAMMGGLIGAAIEAGINKAQGGNKLGCSIDRGDIQSATECKVALLSKGIELTTRDGNSYKVKMRSWKEWKETLIGLAAYGSSL